MFQLNQLDTGDLNSFGLSCGATGQVLRPDASGIFLTDTYLSNQNYIRNYISLTSGSINSTGSVIRNQAFLTGQDLEAKFFNSGQPLIPRDDLISGQLNTTGLIVRNLLTGLSGAFNNTGLFLYNSLNFSNAIFTAQVTGLSGAFNNTGLNIYKLITGLSGAFNISGLNTIKIITGLSGAFNNTGLSLSSFLTGISGLFRTEFRDFANDLNSVSGALSLTGSDLINSINSLSGAFNLTGLRLSNFITGLSGYLRNNSLSILTGIRLLQNNFTQIQTLSGIIIASGIDAVVISSNGQNINVAINFPVTEGKVFDLNNLTGTPFITGSGNLSTSNIGSGFYISGSGFININDSGLIGNVRDSGIYLWNNDLLWSGEVLFALNNSVTGVASLNNSFGNISVTGDSLSFNGVTGQIIIAKTGELRMPSEPLSLALYVTGAKDDDFDGQYLDPRWILLGESSLLNSGITNSYFWANSKLTGLGFFLLQTGLTGIDFEISAKLNFYRSLDTNNFQNIGICLRDSVSKNSFGMTCDLGDLGTTPAIFGARYADQSYSSAAWSSSGWFTNAFHHIDTYFKIKGRNKVYSFEYSEDGIIWREMRMGYSNTQIVDQFGIIMGTRSAGSNRSSACFDWFRTTGIN